MRTFAGYFTPLALGCVLAYLMNPLATFYRRTLFKKTRNGKLRWSLSITLALLSVLMILLFLLGMLVPQLAESVIALVDNLDGCIMPLRALTERLGVADALNVDQLLDSSENIIKMVTAYVTDNIQMILSASASAGKSIANWVIALILSVYLLSSKGAIVSGINRLLCAILKEKRLVAISTFFDRCNKIVIRYIIYNLLDALIVGSANAVFMTLTGMQYVGLVSVSVAVTNLIPTFGPVIGAVIGGFVLLLVKPVHALIFLIFSVVLQFLDGYVIKPRLFGNSLGVSGLLILAAVVVCGNMFGIVGILLSIPIAAILDFVYNDYFLPALENSKGCNNKMEEDRGTQK